MASRATSLAARAASQAPVAGAGPTRSLVGPMITGFAAVVLICVGATVAGSPFDVHMAGAWMFGMGPEGSGACVAGVVAVFVGLVAFLAVWYQVILYLRPRPEMSVRTVLVVFGLWVLPLLVAPPLFSQDAYSYVAQGTMVAQGINPYDHGPVALDVRYPQVVELVDPIWQMTPVPYGPLFLGVEAATVISARHHEVAAVEGLRMLAVAGVLLAAAAIVPLARRWGTPPALAVALALLNPLTLLGVISPGHNDALLAGLLLAAMALLARGRPALAVAVCGLAAGVKAPALIVTGFVTWQWAATELSWTRRLRVVACSSAITFGVLEVFGLVTGVGWGWVGTAGTPGMVRSVVTPTTDLALLAQHLVHVFHFGPNLASLLSATRLLGYLAAVVVIAWLLWRSRHLGVQLALALSLLVIVALGPIFQPWYLAWGVMCLAPVATGRWRVLLIGVSTFATVAALPRFEPLLESGGLLGDVSGILAGLALAALAAPGVATRVTAWTSRIVSLTPE